LGLGLEIFAAQKKQVDQHNSLEEISWQALFHIEVVH
jgi:hypothetical protein